MSCPTDCTDFTDFFAFASLCPYEYNSRAQATCSSVSSVKSVGDKSREGLNPAVLAAGIEAGTGLGLGAGQVAVAGDAGRREEGVQTDEELLQGLALLGGAGVGRVTLGIEAAFVTEADAATVVGTAMGPDLQQTAMTGDGAIPTDVEVIADGAETTGTMVAQQLLYRVGTVGTGGAAVKDDPADALQTLHQGAGSLDLQILLLVLTGFVCQKDWVGV